MALFDDEARMLGQSTGLPMFLGNLEAGDRGDDRGTRRARRLPARRRLPDQRQLHRRQPPQRRRRLLADLPRRRADRLRRDEGALARHRRQEPEPGDGLDGDLPGGLPPRPDAGVDARAGRSRGIDRADLPQQPGPRRRSGATSRADRRLPHRRARARRAVPSASASTSWPGGGARSSPSPSDADRECVAAMPDGTWRPKGRSTRGGPAADRCRCTSR